MMEPYRRGLRRVLQDIRERRHLEAYALFLVTVALTVVGLVGDLPNRLVEPVVLAALAFLIPWTTAARRARPAPSRWTRCCWTARRTAPSGSCSTAPARSGGA
jgi:hypothetical protein